MKKISTLLLAVICIAGAIKSQAQIAPAYVTRLQTVLDSTCAHYHIKGALAAVHIPGKGTWKGVYGEASAGQPISASMAFPLNSNTKTYVAALMPKLQEDGWVC